MIWAGNPKLRLCLRAIQDRDRRIQELQQHLDEYRDSNGDATSSRRTGVASEESSQGIADEPSRARQAFQPVSAPAALNGLRGDVPGKHPRHVKINVKDTIAKPNMDNGADKLGLPNSLFPWPMPKRHFAGGDYRAYEPTSDTRLPTEWSTYATQYASVLRDRM